MNCNPLGSYVHGILWAKILEWVAIPWGSSWPRKRTQNSCIAGGIFNIWAKLCRRCIFKFTNSITTSTCYGGWYFYPFYYSGNCDLKKWSSLKILASSVQLNLVAQSCPTHCNPMDSSMPCFHVHHHLQELAQTHVHLVSDAMQPSSHPLSSRSPPAFKFSQHQGLFQWVSFSLQMAKILEFQLQHQSFQWIFKTDFL